VVGIVRHGLTLAAALRSRRRDDERGLVLVFVAMFLVVLLVITAIVVDLGNARQQKRQAIAAADAGALAGAQTIGSATPTPSGCPDANCSAAYYTASSASLRPSNVTTFAAARSSCTLDPVLSGETCYHYTSGKAAVEVKSPYNYNGTADSTMLHVKICWSSPTPFARVIGTSSLNLCATSTARNDGLNQGSGGAPGATADCYTEDNFADSSDTPTIYVFNPGDYPDVGGTLNFSKGTATPKNNEVLAVLFNGNDSDLDPASIAFNAPTTVSGPNGRSVALPLITPTDNHGPLSSQAHGIGYTVQTLDAAGKLRAYSTGGTYKVVIAYQLPDDAHLKVNGSSFLYTATLHAADKDQTGSDCGNASWSFTHDGKAITSTTTSCGENSFLALGVYHSNGSAHPGDPVGAYYSDESPLQSHDITDPYWGSQSGDYGIDFEISGGRFTHSDGTATQIPKSSSPTIKTSTDGYTITALPAGVTSKETYSNTIQYILPGPTDPRWENGIKYTIFLKAYDTDNNKAGNDCGQGSWSFILTGAVAAASIHLVE
jgi:hypothetical protein